MLVSAEQGQLGTLSHAGSRDLLLFASAFLAEKEMKSSELNLHLHAHRFIGPWVSGHSGCSPHTNEVCQLWGVGLRERWGLFPTG